MPMHRMTSNPSSGLTRSVSNMILLGMSPRPTRYSRNSVSGFRLASLSCALHPLSPFAKPTNVSQPHKHTQDGKTRIPQSSTTQSL